MGLKKLFDKSRFSGTRFIRGINIPPQPNVPKMPEVNPPKKNHKKLDS